MTVDSDIELEGEEIDDKKHDKLVEDILALNKKQNIKGPTRTEPTSEISEFNLVKSSSSSKGSVHINELTKALGNRKKRLDISRVVKATNKKQTTLPAPLHKHQAEQIRRTLNYEKSRFQLDKWEALVQSNRVSNLSFPLDGAEKLKIEEKKAETFPSMWRMKSDLQKELEKLQPVVIKPVLNNDAEESKLTLKKLRERRKESAKLRAFQSYREAKLRRQSKIKSKKYHRMLKKEKIKAKLREFEELQNSNPEEAMKKLDDIERARAEERFSLRHKGTGQWAKNKQVRAKYNKETRQELAQQLAISRELTQKLKSIDNENMESEMYGTKTDSTNAGHNRIKPDKELKQTLQSVGNESKEINYTKTKSISPCVNVIKPDKEVCDFVSGVRKYCLENNEIMTGNGEEKAEKPTKRSENVQAKKITTPSKRQLTLKEKSPASLNESASTSEWKVRILSNSGESKCTVDVETIFDNLENKLSKKLKNKRDKVKLTKAKKNNLNKSKAKIKETKKIDLKMKPAAQKQIIDEELLESTRELDENGSENTVNSFSNIKKGLHSNESKQEIVDIIPETLRKIKKATLQTANPDLSIADENESDFEMQEDHIFEAFEDDNLAEDFQKDKAKIIDENTPKDKDLSLPGWGSWGGTGINPSKRKSKHFILKMPPVPPRKDQNKGSLIINEKAEAKITPFMVSEVPFPFKTVKDYEASIRAPIGNTFVPERAFKKLIEPNITTKMGTIIEPIGKSMLMGKKSLV